MRLLDLVITSSVIFLIDPCLAQTNPPSASNMRKFTPASSIPKPIRTVGELIAANPERRTATGKFISAEVPRDRWSSVTEPLAEPVANTNFDDYEEADAPETPQSIACLYLFRTSNNPQCKLSDNFLQKPTGGGNETIAIVIAYDHTAVLSEFDMFSRASSLPLSTRSSPRIVFASGNTPGRDQSPGNGWDLEASFDLEWAHAMAPDANLILVEADDDTFSALGQAVDVAGSYVQNAGRGVVSISWSWPVESLTSDKIQSFENILAKWNKVTFVVASGDVRPSQGNLVYPAISPNVIAVGGTRVTRDEQEIYIGESAWSGSLAGESGARPKFQDSISGIGTKRGIADLSAVADNGKGGLKFYSIPRGWLGFSGTSASAPIIGGLIVNARSKAGGSSLGSSAQLSVIYKNFIDLGQTAFYDIADGSNCASSRYQTKPGWDFCTGVGVPIGLSGFIGEPRP